MQRKANPDEALGAIRDEIVKQLPNLEGDVWREHLEQDARLLGESLQDRATVREHTSKHEAD